MTLHSAAVGHGPALVLLHGWGMHSGIWAPLLPELARHFRVTCIDLPGHGLSRGHDGRFSLEDAAKLAAAVAPADAAWLGWSLGGQVAMAAAMTGRRISRLLLVATTPRFVTAPDWPCALPAETLAQFAASLAEDCGRTIRNFLTLQLRGDHQAAALLPALRQVLARCDDPDPEALRAGLGILAATDLRAAIPDILQPALVISGERDRLTPAEAGRRLADTLPAGRFLAFPGTAHTPFLSHPDEFVAAVAGFLAGDGA